MARQRLTTWGPSAAARAGALDRGSRTEVEGLVAEYGDVALSHFARQSVTSNRTLLLTAASGHMGLQLLHRLEALRPDRSAA
jgi:hypothetical protein